MPQQECRQQRAVACTLLYGVDSMGFHKIPARHQMQEHPTLCLRAAVIVPCVHIDHVGNVVGSKGVKRHGERIAALIEPDHLDLRMSQFRPERCDISHRVIFHRQFVMHHLRPELVERPQERVDRIRQLVPTRRNGQTSGVVDAAAGIVDILPVDLLRCRCGTTQEKKQYKGYMSLYCLYHGVTVFTGCGTGPAELPEYVS